MGSYIADGQTLRGTITPAKGLHDGLKFTYRPLLVSPRSMVTALADKEKAAGRSGDAQFGKAMAKQITEWDLVDDKGAAVTISTENVLRLQPDLFARLWWIIAGASPSDVEETAGPEQEAENADEAMEAALAGVDLATYRQQAREKNSNAG